MGRPDNGRNNRSGRRAAHTTLPIVMSPLETQAEMDRCGQITASIEAAGFSDKVDVKCGGGNAYITSNTVPDHEVLTGIIHTNEQTVVPAEGFTEFVQLSPELTNVPLTRDASLAVAVNGVPIYDYTGGGEMTEHMLAHHQPRQDTLLTHQLDICGGHAGRADDSTKSLDYNYRGKSYFIRSLPSETSGCYVYTQRTITEDGVLHTREYCR